MANPAQPRPSPSKPAASKPRPSKPHSVLALQGGGALGAYHIGAYQAMAEFGHEPTWFSGISIGAINAAIMAGNPPDKRLDALERFWHMISWPELLPATGLVDFDIWHNRFSNLRALAAGQPNFFRPRAVNPYLLTGLPTTEASFYDTAPLIETLRKLVDFDLINSGAVRLTLGATDVESGEVVYFDSAHPEKTGPIGPEHVLASGSLPPGFPAVHINGRHYWDGGCVSNSPAEAVVQDQPPGHTLIFMIDLWDAAGPAPTTMDEVMWRAKQIQYASRAHLLADALAMKANLRQAARRAARRAAGAAVETEPPRTLDVMHIIYHPGKSTIAFSDAEFSPSSIRERRESGYRDMVELLELRPWHEDAMLEAKAAMPDGGAVLHRVKGGRVFTHAAPGMGRAGDPKHRHGG